MDPAENTYPWSGNPGDHGKKYEKDLAFTLFTAACLGNCQFRLAVEHQSAGKFDDVVMYKEKEKELWLFQSKSATSESLIACSDLFPPVISDAVAQNPLEGTSRRIDDNRTTSQAGKKAFSLPMYMQSFLEIERNEKMAQYHKRYFIFTNKKLEDSEMLRQLVDIETRPVDEVMQFVDSGECYIGFAPKEGACIKEIFNAELCAVKMAIIELFDKGNILEVLSKYKTPLRNVLQQSSDKDYIRYCLSDKASSIEKWLYSELAQHYSKDNREISSVTKQFQNSKSKLVINQSIANFLKGNSREKNLPCIVEEKSILDFFTQLVLCVEQPTDLMCVVDDLIKSWMRRLIRPDDHDKFGEKQAKLIDKILHDEFNRWYERVPSKVGENKELLTFDKEGKKCRQELEKLLGQRIELLEDKYIHRIFIISNQSRAQHESSVSMKSLKSFIRDNEFVAQLWQDSDKDKFSIVIGDPGMGKTTLVQYIESQKVPNLDTYLIYLKQLNVSNPEKYKEDSLAIFEHVLSESGMNNLRTMLETKNHRILILLDGFDELDTPLQQCIIDAIKNFIKKPSVRLIVTGRQHVQDKLEQSLHVKAINLKPLERDEQENLLLKFWRRYDVENTNLKETIEILLDNINSETKSIGYNFAGLPLIGRMLAEVYSDSCRRSDNYDADILEEISVLKLFEIFVRITSNVRLNKILGQPAYSELKRGTPEDFEVMLDDFISMHQIEAIKYLSIHLDRVSKRKYKSRKTDLLKKSPLLKTANEVEFVHLSFAEYFAAKFLFDEGADYEALLYDIFDKNAVVRRFYFLMIEENYSDDSEEMKIIRQMCSQQVKVVFWTCLGGNERIARNLMDNVDSIDTSPYYELLLHAAADGGSFELVRFLLEECKFAVDLKVENINQYKPYFDNLETGYTALHLAAVKGRYKTAEQLLEHKASVDVQDSDGWSPLHLVAQKGYVNLAKLLIQYSANVNTPLKDGWTPLHDAAYYGHTGMIKLLKDAGAKTDAMTTDGRTILYAAACSGNAEVVELLIDDNINFSTNDGWTPLHAAVNDGKLNVIELLLDRSADANTAIQDGITPLYTAADSGSLSIVQLLLQHGAKVDMQTKTGWAPLHAAVDGGHLKVVEMLLKSSADANIAITNGDTPLYMAVDNGSLAIVQLLLQHGADVDKQSKTGWTPLNVAVYRGHSKVAELLLKSNADPNIASEYGDTPLYRAAHSGSLPLVELLLAYQADVDKQTNNGWTPLHAAVNHGFLEVVRVLIDHGADVNIPTAEGITPLQTAVFKNHFLIVDLLRNNSAN